MVGGVAVFGFDAVFEGGEAEGAFGGGEDAVEVFVESRRNQILFLRNGAVSI